MADRLSALAAWLVRAPHTPDAARALREAAGMEADTEASEATWRAALSTETSCLDAVLALAGPAVVEALRRPGTFVLRVRLDAGVSWATSVDGGAPREVVSPAGEPNFAARLASYEARRHQSHELQSDGSPRPEAQEDALNGRLEALDLGGRLAALALDEASRALLALAAADASLGVPTLHLDIAGEDAAAALRLPWELLSLDGAFPVAEGRLDLCLQHGAGSVAPPAPRPLSAVALVAAPITDADAAEEALWRLLGAHERHLFITDAPTAEALHEALHRHHPSVAHLVADADPAGLRLEDPHGRPTPLDPATLPGAGAGVWILESPAGRGDAVDALRRAAARLHAAGAAVLCLDTSFDPDLRRAALGAVYDALAAGASAREVARAARLAAPTASPVRQAPWAFAGVRLYTQAPDARPCAGTTDGAGDILPASWSVSDPVPAPRGAEAEGVPLTPWGFIPRRSATAAALAHTQRGRRVLVVHGPEGVGKTSLCAHLTPLLAEVTGGGRSTQVLTLLGRQAAGPDNLGLLWEQVQAMREGEAWEGVLGEYQKAGLTGAALAEALLQLSREGGGLVLYVDGAESLLVPVAEGAEGRWRDPGVEELFDTLRAEAGAGGGLLLLFSSRLPIEGIDEGDHLALGPMGLLQQVRLLRRFAPLDRFGAPELSHLAGRLDGTPAAAVWAGALALRVLGRGASTPADPAAALLPAEHPDLGADAVFGRLWDQLSPAEQLHLARCCLTRGPAPWELLASLKEDGGSGSRLVELGLLLPCRGTGDQEDPWSLTASTEGAVRRRWRGDTREAQLAIGRWYAARFDVDPRPSWDLAAVRHLCAAGAGDEAWEPARRLALSLRPVGRHREALRWVEQVLAAGVSGPRRGVALVFRAQLARLAGASVLDAIGGLEEATRLVERGDRSFALDELGAHLAAAERYEEAVRVLEQSVSIETADKGQRHPDVVGSLTALARVKQEAGDLDGARADLERVDQIRREAKGALDTPQMATALHELARLLASRGEGSAAREKLDAAIQIRKRVLGPEARVEITRGLHELAGLDMAMGQLSEAKAKLRQALETEIELLGTDHHPAVLTSLLEVSRIHEAMGDLPGARSHAERALAIAADLEAGDAARVDILLQIAAYDQSEGKVEAARARLLEVLELQARLYGDTPREEMATTLLGLAGILQAAGELPECEARLSQALAIQERTEADADGPRVTLTRNLLAGTKKAQGDLAGAEILFRRVLAAKEKEHGEKVHEEVGICAANLAQVLMEQAQFEPWRRDEAGPLLERAYRIFLETLTPSHPLTQQLARLVPNSAVEMMERNPVSTWVLRAFAALDGVTVSPTRLERLAWRIMVRTSAGPLLPMLLMADLDALTPGILAEDPSSLTPPNTAPVPIRRMWSGIVMELSQARVRFRFDFDQLYKALPADENGDLGPPLILPLPDARLDDLAALVDEARAELVGAERRGSGPALDAECDLWCRAAEISLENDDGKDGAEMARHLLDLLPHRRAELLEAWEDLLTDAHRTLLKVIVNLA